ncbi:Histidine kinase (plasmid) [Rhodovastum atsumiense]|nr:PAS domain-containing protein [Rhodovastum atsumiense]CAH2605923.1 Histidine kinase [Rhodovastum atsumiense]
MQPCAAPIPLPDRANLLHFIGELMPDPIYAKDHAGRMLYANPATMAVIGRPADEVICHTAAEYLAEPVKALAIMEADQRILARGEAEATEEEVPDARRGETRVWQSTRAPLRDPATGEVVGLVGISRDVTDDRRTVATLAAERAHLRDLLETLGLGAYMTRDMTGAIRSWSEGCVRLYGWTAAEAVGRISHDLLQTRFPISLRDIEAALERDGEWTGDLRHRTKDGKEIIVCAHKVLRRGAGGRPPAILEALTDVTALRQSEAALATLNRQGEDRVRGEVTARREEQTRAAQGERLHALGHLAGGIAHDFNNVLQAVQGGISVIERRAADAESVRRFARVVASAAERGSAVTRQLLAFARRDELRAERIEPAALLDTFREMLVNILGTKVPVRARIDQRLPVLLADRNQLMRVLMNLATNARDAMPGGGILTLTAKAEEVADDSSHRADLKLGCYVRIEIADTGIGMDQATQARAIEPFFTTKPRERGTGLGLSMAKGFAEQSGGALAIDSEPGRGTTVTLWLPTAEAVVLAPSEGVPRSDRRPSDEVRRVMVVDDDSMVRETMAATLEDTGFAVLTAESGVEALALLEAGEVVDLLVSDFSMPGINGLVLIREAQTRLPGLPAILLTGYAGDSAQLAVDGALSGTFSLLRKPITVEMLVGRIEALLTAKMDS